MAGNQAQNDRRGINDTLVLLIGVALIAVGLYLWSGVLLDDDDDTSGGSNQAASSQQQSGATGASGAASNQTGATGSGAVNIASLRQSLTNYRLGGTLTNRGQTINFTTEVESATRFKTTATVPGAGSFDVVSYDGTTYTKAPGSNAYTVLPTTTGGQTFAPDFSIKQMETFLAGNPALTSDGTKRLADGSNCNNVKFADPQGGAGTACYQTANNRTVLRQVTVTSAAGSAEFNLDNFGNVRITKP